MTSHTAEIPQDSYWKTDRSKLRLFASHLSAHKVVVQEVADRLAEYGISCFVAHTAIQPDSHWQNVIEDSLHDMEALVGFVHSDFKSSAWCDQEVGWAFGRGVPTLFLDYGPGPHGFIAKFQTPATGGQSNIQVADSLVQRLLRHPDGVISTKVGNLVAKSFADSYSWRRTRELVPLLDLAPKVDEPYIVLMERAATDNRDVREADIGGISGPVWVRQFASKHRP